MCSKVSSTSPRPTRLCILRRNCSSGRSPKRFGFTDTEFSYIKARHVAKRNPYDVLGVKRPVSNEELTSHYRRFVAEGHPDKLLARGVPEEFVTIAIEKVATFNEAYDAIAKEREI